MADMPKSHFTKYRWLFAGMEFDDAAERFKRVSEDLSELNAAIILGVLGSTKCGEMVREILNKRLPAELLAIELFQAGIAIGVTLCEQKEENDRKGQTRSPRVQ